MPEINESGRADLPRRPQVEWPQAIVSIVAIICSALVMIYAKGGAEAGAAILGAAVTAGAGAIRKAR